MSDNYKSTEQVSNDIMQQLKQKPKTIPNPNAHNDLVNKCGIEASKIFRKTKTDLLDKQLILTTIGNCINTRIQDDFKIEIEELIKNRFNLGLHNFNMFYQEAKKSLTKVQTRYEIFTGINEKIVEITEYSMQELANIQKELVKKAIESEK